MKFDKMTKAQKRVAIAKDVIKQIRGRRLEIRSGNYWWIKGPQPEVVGQEVLAGPAECVCCAAGSAVLSGIRIFNNKTIRPVYELYHREELENPWFSMKTMALIEAAFEEERICNLRHNLTTRQFAKARAFAEKRKSFKSRAIAIFQNIIKNNGTFKP